MSKKNDSEITYLELDLEEEITELDYTKRINNLNVLRAELKIAEIRDLINKNSKPVKENIKAKKKQLLCE